MVSEATIARIYAAQALLEEAYDQLTDAINEAFNNPQKDTWVKVSRARQLVHSRTNFYTRLILNTERTQL